MTNQPNSDSTELHIHPAGWQSSPQAERFPISLMGHIMPKIYVLIAEVFALPEGTDIDATINSMVAGFEFALSQYPVLAGVLASDDNNGQMWVERTRDSTASLHVKHMTGDEFPSYAELEKRDVRAFRSWRFGQLLMRT